MVQIEPQQIAPTSGGWNHRGSAIQLKIALNRAYSSVLIYKRYVPLPFSLRTGRKNRENRQLALA